MAAIVQATGDVKVEELADGRMRVSFTLEKDDATTVRAAAPARSESVERVIENGIASAIAAGMFY